MPADAQLTERLLTWLEEVNAAWADAGLTRVERRRLSDELESSIREGLESGASVEDFVSDEPGAVAADIATASGFALATRAREEPTRSSFRKTTLIGAAIGALAAWVLFWNAPYLVWFDTIASWVIVYACVLACPLAGPAIAIRRRFPHEPQIRRLQALASSGVLVGIVLAAVPCSAVARLLAYPTFSILVLPEVVLGLAICALTVDLAWRIGWATHVQTNDAQTLKPSF